MMSITPNDWPIDPEFPEGELWLHFDNEVQRLVNSFSYSFKISIVLFSARMEAMLMEQYNPPCDYCNLLQNKLNYRFRCTYANKIECEHCKKQGKMIVYKCYAGLTGAVSPIKIKGELAGYAMLGRVRTSQRVPDEILQAWTNANLNPDELTQAFLSHTYYDTQSLEHMFRLFPMLTSYIEAQEYVRFHQPTVMTQILYWIDMNISDKISLNDIAKKAMCSRSTVSHTIKKHLGISFKDLCILKKIERFEKLIEANPFLSIKEAAGMVGYDDQLYFSRIYKKVRQTPPLNFLNQSRQNTGDNQDNGKTL